MQDLEYMATVLQHGWWALEMDSAAPLHYPKVQLIIVAWMSGFLITPPQDKEQEEATKKSRGDVLKKAQAGITSQVQPTAVPYLLVTLPP